MAAVFQGVWTQDRNIADEDVIAEILSNLDIKAADIIEAAKSVGIRDLRTQYSNEAAKADAVGVPAFVLNGEVFWGQDRIEFIDHALSTNRAPFAQP